MTASMILVICCMAAQLVMALLLVLRRVKSMDFYRFSGFVMCLATGAWAGMDGLIAWNAVWAGALAGFWMVTAAREPARRRRADHMDALRQAWDRAPDKEDNRP